ncbi:MAG: choline-sulfatase, partial [Planctomycetota bacterium]
VEGAPGTIASPILRDTSRTSNGPNLILISIDTLRADHVGAYGASGDNTPTLDALAASGTLVRDVTAQAPFTLPSQVSMFSGQIPSVHGVLAPGRAISQSLTPMLAEILAREGFVTRAFTAGGYLNPIFGFDRGFDGYSNLDPLRHIDSEHIAAMIEAEPALFSRAMYEENDTTRISRWLDAHLEERFFLFLHTYTVHDFDPAPGYINREERIDPTPYMHHEYVQAYGITPEALEDIEAFYDAALRYVDDELGKLLAHLEESGLAENTIIVVTSDHGKELGERGLIVHGTTLYSELTGVPLIMRVPGQEPLVIDEPAMLIDLVPTLLGALGLESDPRMQGIDLMGPSLPEDRVIWSEVDLLAHKYSIRDGSGLKMIHGPQDDDLVFPNEKTWELYSLATDPHELTDLSAERQADRERMQAMMADFRESLEKLSQVLGAAGSGTLDSGTRAMLRQLGYY